jgi:hypothetical protein
MKTIINLLVTGQLTVLLQKAFGNDTGTAVKYSFEPLPSYWAMKPDSREVVMHAHQNNNYNK